MALFAALSSSSGGAYAQDSIGASSVASSGQFGSKAHEAEAGSDVAQLEERQARPSQLARSKSMEGLGPDAQLTGGIGVGFEAKLENFFLGRARLGALYAFQPWIVNVGFTAEVGALAGLGWGAELELSRFGTFFGTAGVARVDESRWLAHLGVGFTIFGLEWQHVFDGSAPHNALLLEVRLPLGLWWLHKRQEKAEAETASANRTPTQPQIVQGPPSNPPPLILGAPPTPSQNTPQQAGPTPNELAARGGEKSAVTAASGGSAASASSATAPKERAATSDAAARETELAARMADAQSARARGDHLAEAMALSRAYALRPDSSIVLQLVAAELALGRPRSALADWPRVGDLQQLSEQDRARAIQLRDQIAGNISKLRISLNGTTSEQDVVWIDGVAEPTANRGYDVPLDPGDHKLQVLRAQRVLIERSVRAEPGKLQRLELELPRD